MTEFTILHGEEIHCNGILMTPKEIITKLQLAELTASFMLQKEMDELKIPRKAMLSRTKFVRWVNEQGAGLAYCPLKAKELIHRIDGFIEYAENTKKFADAGFL